MKKKKSVMTPRSPMHGQSLPTELLQIQVHQEIHNARFQITLRYTVKTYFLCRTLLNTEENLRFIDIKWKNNSELIKTLNGGSKTLTFQWNICHLMMVIWLKHVVAVPTEEEKKDCCVDGHDCLIDFIKCCINHYSLTAHHCGSFLRL
jgi:hypothetical protein